MLKETRIVSPDVYQLLDSSNTQAVGWAKWLRGEVKRETVYGEPPLSEVVREKHPDVTPPPSLVEAYRETASWATRAMRLNEEWGIGPKTR